MGSTVPHARPRGPQTRQRRPRPPRRQNRYHHGDLPQALLDAALRIVKTQGTEALTLRAVARLAGVSQAAPYRHFANKEAILAAVAEDGFRSLMAAMRESVQACGDIPLARLRAVGIGYVTFATSHPSHFRVMFGPRLNEGGQFRAVDALVEEAYQLLESEVRTGMAAGRFGPDPGPHPMVAIWAAMHGLASLVLMKRVEVPDGRLGAWVDRVMGKVVRGLR